MSSTPIDEVVDLEALGRAGVTPCLGNAAVTEPSAAGFDQLRRATIAGATRRPALAPCPPRAHPWHITSAQPIIGAGVMPPSRSDAHRPTDRVAWHRSRLLGDQRGWGVFTG
jgi:hypothetical protein